MPIGRRPASSPEPSADGDDVGGERRPGRSPRSARRTARGRAGPSRRRAATARSRRATGAHDQAVFDRPWMSRTPGGGPGRSVRAAPVEEVDPIAGSRPRRRSRPARRRGPATAAAPSPLGYGRHGQAPPGCPKRPPPLAARTGPSRSWSTAPSRRSRSRSPPRSTRSPIVIADEPTPTSGARTRSSPDETLYGLYEGVPRTEWGADWVADPEPDHALPPAARGGLRRPGRPRRRGLDDGHPRARPSPRHRRRPAPRARRRLTGVSRRASPTSARRRPITRRR